MNRYNLPREDYPITIRMLREDNREVVWEKVVELPNDGPVPIAIPGMAKELGVPIIIQFETATGALTETLPSGQSTTTQGGKYGVF
jgi:hypothetical protein